MLSDLQTQHDEAVKAKLGEAKGRAETSASNNPPKSTLILRSFAQEAVDDNGNTLLMAAVALCTKKQLLPEVPIKAAKLLLDYGAQVNASDKEGKTSLHWAAGLGSLAIVKLLLEQYYQQKSVLGFKSKRSTNSSPAHYDRKADRNALTCTKESALHLASRYGHADVVRFLLKRRVNQYATRPLAPASRFTILTLKMFSAGI